MEEQHLFKTLNENLDSLLNLKKKLAMLNDVKLNTLYSTLTPKNFIKKIAKNREKIKSTLCVKVKQKNIRKVSFGICVDIGVDIIYDYLHDKEILSINLNFNLKNLSSEYNNLYFIHNIEDKSQLTSFVTKENKINNINLDNNIELLQNQIESNNKLSFFIPMFESYDNYEEFHEAIDNVTLDINYNEN